MDAGGVCLVQPAHLLVCLSAKQTAKSPYWLGDVQFSPVCPVLWSRPLIISVSWVSGLAILGRLFFWVLVDGLPAAVCFQFLLLLDDPVRHWRTWLNQDRTKNIIFILFCCACMSQYVIEIR
jgi:hypothetical protein